MFNKINCWLIVKDHFNTLRDYRSKRISKGDIFLFIIIPFVVSGVLLYYEKFPIDDSASNILITSLSVFSALLFNLLLLIYDIVRKEGKNNNKSSLVLSFLQEIYANISYSIFISVITVAFLLTKFFDITNTVFNGLVSFVVYYLTVQFLLTLFMILKRVHVMLSKEIQREVRG